MLYELFRICVCECDSSYEEALKEHMKATSPDPNLWKLHEGFVAAEAKSLLPHIAKYRSESLFINICMG